MPVLDLKQASIDIEFLKMCLFIFSDTKIACFFFEKYSRTKDIM